MRRISNIGKPYPNRRRERDVNELLLSIEQQRDWLLSSIITMEALARAGTLSNENVIEITKATLAKISAPAPTPC